MAHELQLRAQPGVWRLFATRREDPKFKEFMKKVFERDDYVCQFCGFQAHDFQEVVNLDHDYKHNTLSNMVTSCVFCAQCMFLESVGAGDFGGGTLIYLPEVSQTELNSFCHVLFCAMANDTGYKGTAQSIYRSFKFRYQLVEKEFGEGSSDPAVFGQLLADNPSVTPDKMRSMLKDIRLLPSRAKFKKQIEHWAVTALDELAAQV